MTPERIAEVVREHTVETENMITESNANFLLGAMAEEYEAVLSSLRIEIKELREIIESDLEYDDEPAYYEPVEPEADIELPLMSFEEFMKTMSMFVEREFEETREEDMVDLEDRTLAKPTSMIGQYDNRPIWKKLDRED